MFLLFLEPVVLVNIGPQAENYVAPGFSDADQFVQGFGRSMSYRQHPHGNHRVEGPGGEVQMLSHDHLVEMAENATVPVINGLSDLEHPCQAISDMVTISEHQGELPGLKLAFVGDGNNVARSLCLGLPAVGMTFAIATPPGYQLDQATLELARERANGNGAVVQAVTDPQDAVLGADVVYTDVWASMGQEGEANRRRLDFQGYTVDAQLLAKAKPSAKFMHDMPAHYGEEVAPGMLEHPQSLAYQQAHNRLHGQKAVLELLLG